MLVNCGMYVDSERWLHLGGWMDQTIIDEKKLGENRLINNQKQRVIASTLYVEVRSWELRRREAQAVA